MNTPENKLGLVDNPVSQSIDNKYMAQDEVKPVDNTFPTITPEPFYPDVNNSVQEYGEYQLSGVYSNAPQSLQGAAQDYEPFEQWEQKVLRQQKENLVNRTSIHMQPPTSSGAPFINEQPNKPSQEQIDALKKQQDINDIQQRLALLQQSSARLQKDLDRNHATQRVLIGRLEELND